MNLIDLPTGSIKFEFAADNINYQDRMKLPEYNQLFIRSSLDYAKSRLEAQGHFFVNEMFDLFSLPRTPEGQIRGWLSTDPPRTNWEWSVDENLRIWVELFPSGQIWDLI